MIPALPWKLIGYGVGALALIAIVATVLGWRSERNELRAWQAEVMSATKDASANPKLKPKDAAQQIRLLGQAIADLKSGIARQNAAVNALATESARQQQEAGRAVLRAAGRAQSAEATAERLRVSSRAGGASTGVCEPSRELQESWK